jgi:acetyl-CoA carboxylase biotin carboxyl carrier protein
MAKKSKLKSSKATPALGVDLPQVERLLSFMQKHGLEEFEYERNGLHVRLKKPSASPPPATKAVPAQEIVVAGSHASPETSPASAPAPGHGGAAEAGRSEDVHVVESPIVGTFYASASPGGGPFVTVGAHVESGQVLCIIEAMKLMNEIESDVAGEVVRIFVENGQPVEYGEPLFGIHPQRKK